MTETRTQFIRSFAGITDDQVKRLESMDDSDSILQGAKTAKLDEATVVRSCAQAIGAAFISSLAGWSTSAEFVAQVPIAFARRHLVFGVSDAFGRLFIALGDVQSWQQLGVLSHLLGRAVEPLFSPSVLVTEAINEAYQQRTGQAQAAIEHLNIDPSIDAAGGELQDALRQMNESGGREDLLDVATRAPVIRLVNLILFEAVKAGASDVHVQPLETKLAVRLRIDGLLYNSFELPKSVQEEVVGRIKVMGKMNIAEKRLAQDGRATVQVGDRMIDLRLASLPTSFGERVVIRLLDKSARLYRLDELGMPPASHAAFRRLIKLEHGLILVTGPTGSGKSTTLYAALKEIDAERHNVLTLEDPIEYQLEGISQTQVSDKKGMTFAGGLRSVLRQDPDIIMVGEIRDRETATMAIQSALTGHLVFSTLHTNDAASAVTRLLDLGIEPYLVASSVVGVMAQRLVRRICANCRVERTASVQDQHWLGANGGVQPVKLSRGCGCSACRASGYRGRLGIFELLEVNNEVRQQVQSLATAAQIKDVAVFEGMKTMRDDGIDKVLKGVTTIEEVERVTVRAADNSENEEGRDNIQ